MSKKISVDYEYIINCSSEVEVDDDFDVDDETTYDYIVLPDRKIEIKIDGEYYDCDFVGISDVSECCDE